MSQGSRRMARNNPPKIRLPRRKAGECEAYRKLVAQQRKQRERAESAERLRRW